MSQNRHTSATHAYETKSRITNAYEPEIKHTHASEKIKTYSCL